MSLSLASSNPLDHVLPHRLHEHPLFTVKVGEPGYTNELFNIHDGKYEFFITNHFLMASVAAGVLLVIAAMAAKRISVVGSATEDYVTKGRVAQFFEVVLVFLRDEMARPALGALTDKYIGYIWTTFFFILTANLLGMIPFAEALNVASGGRLEHLGGTATGNLAVTAVLALISFFVILFSGVREQGIRYFAHYAPIPFKPIAMAPIAFLLVALEVIGAFVKPFALCMRLFANMLAGHMVLAALLGLILIAAKGMGNAGGYAVSVPVLIGSLLISLLELFVCFLQAYVFTFLTVLFIAQGAVHHHDEHGHEGAGPGGPENDLSEFADAGTPPLH